MTNSYETYRRTRTFSAFDGLRGLLSILIVWCHATHTQYHYGYASLPTFFLISGFLITTLLLRERDRHGEISLKMFYARRTLRIFPLYYTVIGLYTLAVVLLEKDPVRHDQFLSNLKYFLTYTSNWFVNDDPTVGVIFFFSWSLATEEQFYIIWPWIERYTKGWTPIVLVGVLILINQLTVMGALNAWIDPSTLAHRVLHRISTPICLGVILAHVLHNPRGFAIAAKLLGQRWMSVAMLIAAFWGAGAMYTQTSGAWPRLAEELILLLFVTSCVVREDHWLSVILAWKPATRVGIISYGTYLLHMLAVNLARTILHKFNVDSDVAVFLLGYPMAITAAAISYRYYESIFLRMKSRFDRNPSRPMEHAGSPAVAAKPAATPAASPDSTGAASHR